MTTKPGKWLTPDDPPGDLRWFRVYVPEGDGYESALRGALCLLADADNWELFGSATPEEVAQAFEEANALTMRWDTCPYDNFDADINAECD